MNYLASDGRGIMLCCVARETRGGSEAWMGGRNNGSVTCLREAVELRGYEAHYCYHETTFDVNKRDSTAVNTIKVIHEEYISSLS